MVLRLPQEHGQVPSGHQGVSQWPVARTQIQIWPEIGHLIKEICKAWLILKSVATNTIQSRIANYAFTEVPWGKNTNKCSSFAKGKCILPDAKTIALLSFNHIPLNLLHYCTSLPLCLCSKLCFALIHKGRVKKINNRGEVSEGHFPYSFFFIFLFQMA